MGSHSPVFGSRLLRPKGWVDEDATWYGNRAWPRPHCIRRGPISPRKGHSSHRLFLAHVYSGHGRPSQLLLSSCNICFPNAAVPVVSSSNGPGQSQATKYISCILCQFFGRQFIKRFALSHRTVVLSVCPVCDVGVLWPNGWTIKMKLSKQVGLGPGHTALDGDLSAPRKGVQQPHIRYLWTQAPHGSV